MDTTGTSGMALGQQGLPVALHKRDAEDGQADFFLSLQESRLPPATASYATGIGKAGHDKFSSVMARSGHAIDFSCLDVADGYTKSLIGFVKKVRAAHPLSTIMAGDMTDVFNLAGAGIVQPGSEPAASALQDIPGGARSACTGVGTRKRRDLTQRTTSIRVTQQLDDVLGKS